MNFFESETAAPKPRRTPELRVVHSRQERPAPETVVKLMPSPLDGLLDGEIQEIVKQKEFAKYLEFQAEPIRQLIKSGYSNFVTKILPLEKTVRKVESEGMNFAPVVVSGIAAGLPSDVRFPFDRAGLDDLILGRNFIKKVPEDTRRRMLEKNVERLRKGPSGEVEIQTVEDMTEVIQLAGFFGENKIIEEYDLDERMVRAMDVTTKLAVVAGLEALRDAGIPLVRMNRTTSIGQELPDSWALPPSLRAETGIIFASAFPGMASLVDEVTRQASVRYGSGAKKRLIDFYTGLVSRVADDRERDRVTKWFTEEFGRLNTAEPEELYTFNRDFLMRVTSMGHGQLAQIIKAQGPNTHIDAACAGTTQAVALARDWVRTGQAKRVLVVAADDVAGKHLFPWIGTGFLALGAATTEGDVSEAALPFDDRRHGLILGSAAAGLVIEREDLVTKRGMEPIASIEGAIVANSGFHGTRLDVDHIASVMESLIGRWEEQTGNTRSELAKNAFFMSHETYSPKRGGSSSAEMAALRRTFGDEAKLIPIANTKGFTGHTMGAGLEDVVALRCLQKKILPPIPNLKQPDPEFADLNMSQGGSCEAKYSLRLAAGFGSQIVMTLYKAISRDENRVLDLRTHRNWLKDITGYGDPVVSVEARTLRVADRIAAPAVKEPVAEPVHEPAPAAKTDAAADVTVVRNRILALLSEKTGYPSDMLDTGLDLEADLGIDTVKQAEFISDIRETFNIPRIDGLKIAEFPTIEHIINFVLQHTGAHTAPAPTTQSPADDSAVREKVLALLSAKTGYPADMLDTALDLEADLGIDTVKQAEFISEVRETFNVPRIDGLKIAEFPTIEHIINFVLQHTGAQTAPAAAQQNSVDESAVREKILALLSAKTGYPAEMLDPELDLEADLGIDTVKQAEFISEIRDMFTIPRIEGLKIAEFPTINHIIHFVMERSQGAEAPAAEAKPVEQASDLSHPVSDVRLYETKLVSLPPLGNVDIPDVDTVLIIGGTQALVAEVQKTLASIGLTNTIQVNGLETQEVQTGRIGIVNLTPLDQGSDYVNKTFQLYIDCAKQFETGPAFMITAVSEDGAYGFDAPAEDCDKLGTVAGATKSFSKEFPESVVRLLDFHPDLTAETRGSVIARCISEDFPLETGVGINSQLRAVRLAPCFPQAAQPAVNSGEVVLVTGGARGITAACMKRLAAQQPLTIIIFARTAIFPDAEKYAKYGASDWTEEKTRIIERLKSDGQTPTPVLVEKRLTRLKAEAEVFKNIADLRSMGCEVIYRSLDIRDSSAVNSAIEEISGLCGRIDIVIHGAGIDASRALRSKTLEQIQDVVSVKVQGMRNVLDALESHGLPPRRIVGFGSVSGRFGNMAQVDYSAANDALAHLLRKADKELDAKVSIIDWAPWAEIGMAVRGSVQQALEDAGIDFIPPEIGAELFSLEMTRSQGTSEVLVAGKLGPFTADAFGSHSDTEAITFPAVGTQATVLELIPGRLLKAKISLDPAKPLLNHHRINRAAVLPGVGGLEIMKCAASQLSPDVPFAQFEDVKFRSPVKVFKTDPFEAEVEITRLEDGKEGLAFQGRILSWFIDKNGNKFGEARLHHEAVIRFMEHEAPSPVELQSWQETVWVAEPDIYSVFFHGPAYKFLDHLVIEGSGNGIRFQFQDTAERSVMFEDMLSVAIETVFQVCAGLGLESRGVMALPVGIARAQLLQENPVPFDGEFMLVKIHNDGLEGRTTFRFDGFVRDNKGNKIIDLNGVEMMELQTGERFTGRVFEQFANISDISTEAGQNPGFIAEMLHVNEVKEHDAKTVAKRATEWLAGRVAAKRSVQRLAVSQGKEVPKASLIVISNNDKGKPIVDFTGEHPLRVGDLSISHSNGLVLAAIADEGTIKGLGVDIEKIETRSASWIKDYFDEAEVAIAGSGENKWIDLAKIWSLKEAVLKALGTGLRFDLKDIVISNIDDCGRASVEFRNEASKFVQSSNLGVLQATVTRLNGVVMARVVLR